MNDQRVKASSNIDLTIKKEKCDDIDIDTKKIEYEHVGDSKKKVEMVSLHSPKIEKKKSCCFVGCRKRLMLTDMKCRCGSRYCSKHRISSDHNCTFNYKNHERNLLEKNNQQVIGEKVTKI